MATSTLSSYFSEILSLGRMEKASSTEYFLSRFTSSAALRYFLPAIFRSLSKPPNVRPIRESHHFQAHRPSGALDGTHRRFQVGGVEIGELEGRDVADLLLGHLADLVLVRLPRALL